MPIFFIISGYLYYQPAGSLKQWMMKKIKRFLIPYFTWYVLVTIIGLNQFSILQPIKLIYGGRILTGPLGTWWFTTVSLLTLLCVATMIRYIKSQKVILLVLICMYCLGFAESELAISHSKHCLLLINNFPWNIDVCLMSIPLFFIGIYLRNHQNIFKKLNTLVNVFESGMSLALFEMLLCISDYNYTVDMKYSRYGNFIFFIPVVLLWGIFLLLLVKLIDLRSKYIKKFLNLCGLLSYPIMFIHMGIVQVLKLKFNGPITFIIAIVISVGISYIFNRNKATRILFITG